ncbi:MAG: DUF4065 domain-containing protein [Chloroherpetonaceae bacterium]|nr:DUF4065 domain-containing protein [Chloroherpetonaceae bacterium]
MKSPITGKEMTLKKEKRSMEFRKEKIEIVYHYYKCEDSGEQFTTTALDELNINQVHNRYREKFNIPFPEEIAGIREKYGLSAVKMSEVLGFGVNGYRQYEAGEIPSIANAKIIQMVDDSTYFTKMVELSTTLSSEIKLKVCQRARQISELKDQNRGFEAFQEYMLGKAKPDTFSGYKIPSLEKIAQMISYFAKEMQPYKTKLNKLLFYADFLMYKESGFSISGMRYKAIDMGPVPGNFQSIYEYLANQGEIDILSQEFPNGKTGEQFIPKRENPFKADLFTEKEIRVLEKVAKTFRKTTTQEMIELSHSEEAWKANEKIKAKIHYDYAFELNLS